MMAFIFDICLVRLVDDLKEVDIALLTVDERMILGPRRTCPYILGPNAFNSSVPPFVGDHIS